MRSAGLHSMQGLHAVCEKPLCFTSEQADELLALAEEKPDRRRDVWIYRGADDPPELKI